MPVTHRPLLARAPLKPARSPESRWPQGRRYSFSCRVEPAITIRLAAPIRPRSPAPIVCTSRIVTGGLLLVTMRTMPRASKTYTVLSQVTTLSDELFWRITTYNRAMRFVSPARSQRASFDPRATRAPASPGQWVTSMEQPPTGASIEANATCRAGKQHNNDTNREWCPESLVALVLLRQARRTVTLT